MRFIAVCVRPPTAWWLGGNSYVPGDWRPTWLAIGLLATFVLISLVPGLRSLFLLSALISDQIETVPVPCGRG